MSRTTRGRSARRWSFSIIGGKASQLSQILKNFILKNYWRGNLEGNLKQKKVESVQNTGNQKLLIHFGYIFFSIFCLKLYLSLQKKLQTNKNIDICWTIYFFSKHFILQQVIWTWRKSWVKRFWWRIGRKFVSIWMYNKSSFVFPRLF